MGTQNNFKLQKIREAAGRKAMAQATMNEYKENSKKPKPEKSRLQVEIRSEVYRYIYAVYGRKDKGKYIENLILKDLNEEAGEQKGFF